MDFGSVKNVGISVIDTIVAERKANGKYKSFVDFCERISEEAVNKKCIESLIKSGAFDEFGDTRNTLLASFEKVIDTINDTSKRSLKGQVSMFDLNTEDENMESIKYTFIKLDELSQKELLAMEKEIVGIYISGHPLDKLREEIKKVTNIDTKGLLKIKEEGSTAEDGRIVRYAGVVTKITKKYTKNNTQMAFVTIEDLYGSSEIIAFDSCFNKCANILQTDNIVLVEGRLSIREDEDIKIVANNITEIEVGSENKKIKKITLNITNVNEESKAKLRGAIRFFSGDKNNIEVEVIDGNEVKPCGLIYLTKEILKEFEDILGSEKVKLI